MFCHCRQLPSTRRVIPTVTQRAVERETDRRSVLPVPLTFAIQTFLRVPTGRNPTADLEKAVKEVSISPLKFELSTQQLAIPKSMKGQVKVE